MMCFMNSHTLKFGRRHTSYFLCIAKESNQRLNFLEKFKTALAGPQDK